MSPQPNCSDVEEGMCLKRVKPIVKELETTDKDKCCAVSGDWVSGDWLLVCWVSD